VVAAVVASTLTLQIVSTVTDIKDSTTFLPAGIITGNFINTALTYTTTATDTNSSSEYGVYKFNAAPDTLSITVNGDTWQPSSNFNMTITVRNGTALDSVTFELRGVTFPTGHSAQSGNALNSLIQIRPTDTTAAKLINDSLPTALTLSDWDLQLVEVLASVPGGYYRILGEQFLSFSPLVTP